VAVGVGRGCKPAHGHVRRARRSLVGRHDRVIIP
jgi:hypothetical protein